MPYDPQNPTVGGSQKSYNTRKCIGKQAHIKDISQFAQNLIGDKEHQIKIASMFMKKSVVSSLRDELEALRTKYAQFLPEDPIDMEMPPEEPSFPEDIPPMEDDSFGMEDDGDPVPASEAELNDLLFQSVADSFTTVLNEEDQPVFDVSMPDPETIVISYSAARGGTDKAPFVYQNLEQFMKPVLLDIIGKVGFGEEDPEARKQELVDELKEPLQMYRDSLQTQNQESKTKEGKNILIYKRSEESLETASRIYDILKRHGLAGPIADRDYEEIARSDNDQNINMMGEPTMEAKKKSFNLRKHADKVYDSVRERAIQESDPQYRSRHGDHALPWYEDAYIAEEDYKRNIMDRYYPERLNSEGEYRGGYINDRFTVHHNTEGNSMHVKPGTRRAPDRTESYSTERRLEVMRNNDDRGYELSEGSETEQQTHEVHASNDNNIVVSEEHGLYKIVCGSKVAYMDTEGQVEAFKAMQSLIQEEGEHKKKVAQTNDFMVEVPESEEVGVSTINTEAEEVSPDNPLLSIVQDLQGKYPNMPIEKLVQQGIVQLSAAGMDTGVIERFRVETMRALGMPAEQKDYGQIEVDQGVVKDELTDLMGE